MVDAVVRGTGGAGAAGDEALQDLHARAAALKREQNSLCDFAADLRGLLAAPPAPAGRPATGPGGAAGAGAGGAGARMGEEARVGCAVY
jgi:hypothetical protein